MISISQALVSSVWLYLLPGPSLVLGWHSLLLGLLRISQVAPLERNGLVWVTVFLSIEPLLEYKSL